MAEVLENRQEALEWWRSKLREAQAQHSSAVIKYQQVCRDYNEGFFDSANGSLALQRAQREVSAALEEYMRVLKIFADLVLRGQPPPDV
jgi:hypothetical protein